MEKYITFCKNKYIDDVMKWRLKFLECKFPKEYKNILQFRMLLIKGSANKMTEFYEPDSTILRKDYDNLGAKVTQTPALLDPSIPFDEAKQIHADYINGTGQFAPKPDDLKKNQS